MENNLHASKRRGRPAGSKNKPQEPKPSAGVRVHGVATKLRVLEVAAGADVISAVSDFANRLKLDVSVISTYGLVHSLTIYQPRSPPQRSSIRRCEGVFDLLSLKAIFHGSSSSTTRPSPVFASHLIYFADGEGNAVSGIIAGRVLATTNVFLVVAIMREINCIQVSLTSPAQANYARQPEVGSSARGSMSSHGVPCPTPPLMATCAPAL